MNTYCKHEYFAGVFTHRRSQINAGLFKEYGACRFISKELHIAKSSTQLVTEF